MRTLPPLLLLCLCLLAAPVLADDVFHGWSKDGTWLVYETKGENDLVELHFCVTDPEVKPTWPKELNELDREEGRLACVNFIDPNKAPYQWKLKLVLPPSSLTSGKLRVLSELVRDGTDPGFTVESGDKRQVCYASGMREDSKLQKVWWHSSGNWVAALIDGQFRHCTLQVRPPAATATKPPGGKHR